MATYFPEKKNPELAHLDSRSKKATLASIDYIGGFLSIFGVILFVVALQRGGFTHSWNIAYVLTTLLIVFPHTFSTLYDPEPVVIGVKGIGYGIAITLGAATFNMLLTVFKKYNNEVLLVASVIMTAFIGALAAATPYNPKLTVALGSIGGFGVGGILVPASSVALTACPDHLIGTTVALSLSARVIGGSIGYAIYYNIFVEKLKAALPVCVATAAAEADLPQSELLSFVSTFLTVSSNVVELPNVTETILGAAVFAAREAYAHAFKYFWLTSIACGVLAVIFASSCQASTSS
ncbi:Hypothetical protein R9X50_00518800 [Acrodontium crateriforme]|uniref:Uncharacterized protein n=1 Tax=Acrodontium crateriforme TaxID=150365 RepID=A0AAQ3RBB1_9PEZI|nr:Hypothetical protein R9X50_00518800 [Acrodontium crateriforme]